MEGKSSVKIALGEKHTDPAKFLRAIMNHEELDVATRITAAKALMPFAHKRSARVTEYVSKRDRDKEEAMEGEREFFGD